MKSTKSTLIPKTYSIEKKRESLKRIGDSRWRIERNGIHHLQLEHTQREVISKYQLLDGLVIPYLTEC